MKVRDIKGIGYLPMIVLSILVYKLIDNFEGVKSIFSTAIRTMTPLIWGFVFAYFLNPFVRMIQIKLGLKRGFGMLITYILFFILLFMAAMFVGPTISDSITDIINKTPEYAKQLDIFYNEISKKYPVIEQYININSTDQNAIGKNINKALSMASDIFGNVFLGIVSFTGNLFKVVIGLIISVYFLKDKEKFQRGIKKILYSIFPATFADKVCDAGNETNVMFSKYFIGKIIDSIIIGIICFFGMLLIKAPYPVLLAVIIGITNMIPFFGPFIGAVPAIILAFLNHPMTAVSVGIFVLLLQQFDGYILGPKILGDSVGLSAFWIIVAILVGGVLMGVVGMLIAVPVAALIRNVLISVMDNTLTKKNLKKYI